MLYILATFLIHSLAISATGYSSTWTIICSLSNMIVSYFLYNPIAVYLSGSIFANKMFALPPAAVRHELTYS